MPDAFLPLLCPSVPHLGCFQVQHNEEAIKAVRQAVDFFSVSSFGCFARTKDCMSMNWIKSHNEKQGAYPVRITHDNGCVNRSSKVSPTDSTCGDTLQPVCSAQVETPF